MTCNPCKDLYVVKVNMSNITGFEYIGFSFEDAYECFEKKCDIKNKLVDSVELCVTKYPGDTFDLLSLYDCDFFKNLNVLCYTSVKALRNIKLFF